MNFVSKDMTDYMLPYRIWQGICFLNRKYFPQHLLGNLPFLNAPQDSRDPVITDMSSSAPPLPYLICLYNFANLCKPHIKELYLRNRWYLNRINSLDPKDPEKFPIWSPEFIEKLSFMEVSRFWNLASLSASLLFISQICPGKCSAVFLNSS